MGHSIILLQDNYFHFLNFSENTSLVLLKYDF